MTQFVTRAEAGLRAPSGSYSVIAPEGITVHYGGPSPWAGPADHARCASIWRAWQAFHIDERGWVDIAYTSGVCPHGARYEGRPSSSRTAAQGTHEGNRRSLAVVYIAGVGDPLTDEARWGFLDEAHRLGVPLRWVHSDWHATACPGDGLRQWKAVGWEHPSTAGVPALPPPPPPPPSLSDARTRTREVQQLLGAAADGIWGPKTAGAANVGAFGWSPDVRARGYRGVLPLPGNKNRALVQWYQRQANRRFGIGIAEDGLVGPATNHVVVVLDGQADAIAGAGAIRRATL